MTGGGGGTDSERGGGGGGRSIVKWDITFSEIRYVILGKISINDRNIPH